MESFVVVLLVILGVVCLKALIIYIVSEYL